MHAKSMLSEQIPSRKRINVKVLARKDTNYANCGASFGGTSSIVKARTHLEPIEENEVPTTATKRVKLKIKVAAPTERDYSDCGRSFGGDSPQLRMK